MLVRITLLALIIIALPSKALAYDTLLTMPLHQGPRGVVVGGLEDALPRTITFRDATHADVTFVTRSFEMRGSVDIAEGRARIRSTQHLVLSGSPFRIEVEPGNEVSLVNGLRREVRLEGSMPIEGLDVTVLRLRVASEETLPARDATQLGCQPIYLWPEPRVHGPVIRTTQGASLVGAPSGVTGWSEVWVHERGVWLRGYAWEGRRCGDGYGTIGVGYAAATDHRVTRVTLPNGARIASALHAPWTVLLHEALEVERFDAAEGRSFYRFALDEGSARIEGVVLP